MSYIGNQPNSVAFLTDQFSGNGSTTVFTMSVAPATTSSILVAITGVVQDPSTYSVSGTTLTFSAAPPSGTGNISVRYLGIPASGVVTTAYRTVTEFTATAGQTSFSVPSYTVGYISVYRNGVMLGSADFTATTGTTVVLAAGASAGDLVTTESFYVSSVLNAIPATAGAVNSTYIANDAVGSAQIAAGAVGTSEIADANVTVAKLSTGAPSWDSSGNLSTSGYLATPGFLYFNSGYGSAAVAYGCRAWVNFNGTGTVAIRASGNVTSITDNGTGNYTLNFTTAMPDANYSASILCSYGGSSNNWNVGYILDATAGGANPTTTALRFATLYYAAGFNYNDPIYVNLQVFR